MRRLSFILVLASTLLASLAAQAAPVLMISIDGLRPADVIDAGKRGFAAVARPEIEATLAACQ